MTEVSPKLANWAGNVRFHAAGLRRPQTVAELQRLVAGSRSVRALGTGHSFSPVADTTGDLVSVAGLPPRIEIDADRATVTVSGGLRYSEITPRLHAAGLALASLGSLPHISVAGAVATGTHGSGDSNRGLAAAVTGLELVTADGDLVTATRDGDPGRFPGMVVSLGTLGIVTSLTLAAVPAFALRQYVYDGMPFNSVTGHFAEIAGSGYSVSMFTGWRQRRLTQTWLKLRDGQGPPPAEWRGGRAADGPRHPVPGQPAENCTPQQGVPGPWHERLPHFRPEFMPSAGAELQSEYLVGREHAVGAFGALDEIRDVLAPVVQVSEIRTVAADDLWLSPCYGRDSASFHFTWVPDTAAVEPVIDQVETALAPFAARPHWGKLFHASPASRYPRLADFTELAREFDPAGKFGNAMLDAYLPRSG